MARSLSVRRRIQQLEERNRAAALAADEAMWAEFTYDEIEALVAADASGLPMEEWPHDALKAVEKYLALGGDAITERAFRARTTAERERMYRERQEEDMRRQTEAGT
ncbi:MAG: hypothetical protein IT330_17320 [Anaerolineae bacterium]|nr:hypothetical protein [Anaerolineae bacterium]